MIVDTALRKRQESGTAIRVGLVGAGATGRAIALQLGTPAPGIRLAAIANRTVAHGERALRDAGITHWVCADSPQAAEAAITRGVPVLTDDASALTGCAAIDVIVDVTGTIDAAARAVLRAFDHRKD